MAQIARQTAADESPRTAGSIGEIITASSHLLGILNDVLDMSKTESGKFALASEPFSVLSAADEVRQIIGQRCTEKGITFNCHTDDLPDNIVKGDRLRINQVLINLLGNAVKFTDKDGQVGLAVHADAEDEAGITFSYTVTDNGIGMTEEQISRLFRPFEQADSSIAARFGGTGLGLAISQNLVNQMGGEIVVESTPDRGSTFSFTLTFEKTDETPIEAFRISEQGSLNLSGHRILLVEDIEINRVILIELLSDTGLVIDEAANGEEALERFGAAAPGTYDLIFMDIQMPGMDGYEVTRRIRALERPDAHNVDIIAMTANAYREDIERALAAGMNGHVAKPIDIGEVRHLLAKKLLTSG